MPATMSCGFTKGLIPYVEREVGPEGVAALLRAAGRPRDYLMSEYNHLPIAVASDLVRLCQELMGEPDEERWTRRFTDDFMDWKPSRDERNWGGAYSMSLGSPRAIYGRPVSVQTQGWGTLETVWLKRRQGLFRVRPDPGLSLPRWLCTWNRVCYERYPTNWGLPRARVVELACAARGDPACLWDVRWKNPSLGARFWTPTAAGITGSVALALALGTTGKLASPLAGLTVLPALCGVTAGHGLRERRRRRELERLRDLQAEEILYSTDQLQGKFRDLEGKIEQLSLLSELAAAVNATLDVEKIYEQTLHGLVQRMGYENASLFLSDPARGVIREHRMVASRRTSGPETPVEFPLAADASAVSKTAVTGLSLLVSDVEASTEPVDVPTARALNVRSSVMAPLRVKEGVVGVLVVMSSAPGTFGEADRELLEAVANHVALAVDRAESFRTIEELSRGLEDKVRVRTEQLRTANEEVQAAYRELQATQVQLIQREKMASVGQLVAGVAHELNNPIGFVYSNVTTLEDFVGRLRGMLEVYRGTALPEGERARVDGEWAGRKVDYALKYLDAMTQGIREGAERARKIVRDLRVFARSQDDVWQAVDVHEELESSLTLLNHLLKDRVTVHRKFGPVPAVECIRSAIDQVFLNLLANATQAIAGEGAITIETREEEGRAVVVISDTGPGIPAEVLGRVFDPFFTTKPVGEGTGLGLSISYEIVKKHSGEIRAESPAGGGAVFTLRLPLARTGPR
jgi:signal transduction histidine kinase